MTKVTTQDIQDALDRGDFMERERLANLYKEQNLAETMERSGITAEEVISALLMFGSEQAAEQFVSIADGLPGDVLAEVMVWEWSRFEANKPYREKLVELFGRTGFLTDDEAGPPWGEDDTLTIYRGNQGEDEPQGIAWTLSLPDAERFARWTQSMRGMFLGIKDPDGWPTVWEAKVHASDVLGWFSERGEQEVVVDPATVYDAVAIREAIREGGQ